jgi:cytochrome c-type biogenesis protein CcmE
VEVDGESAPRLDLSPREVVPTAARGKKKPYLAYVVLGLVVVAGGVFVTKFLTNAIDYYCNVDEISVKDGCDAGRTIRIQGVVDKRTVEQDGSVTRFDVQWNGAVMPVDYEGEASGIFADLVNPDNDLQCIPVVVRGSVVEDGAGEQRFAGDEVIVKHDNTYDAENEDRVDQSNAEAAACSAQ